VNWETVQDAIAAAVVATTGANALDVFWRGSDRAAGLKGYPQIELVPSGLAHAGVDEIRKVYSATPSPTRAVEYVGNRRLTVSIRIYHEDGAVGTNALALADRLRTRLRRPSVLADLRAADVSLARILASVDGLEVDDGDGRLVSLSITDVLFLVAERDTGTPETGGWVDTAAGEASIDGNTVTF